MSGPTSSSTAGPLTNTLILALTQCQDQVRQLEQQSTLIDNLRRENERLKQELEQSRRTPTDGVEAKYKAQFQNVFKQVAEKQAEVDRLKEKLRTVKIKTQQRGLADPISSSPALSTSAVGAHLPPFLPSVGPSQSLDEDGRAVEAAIPTSGSRSTESMLPPRKRTRSPSPSRKPLQEVSANIDLVKKRPNRHSDVKSRRQTRTDTAIAAIPELAEDGEDHLWRKSKHETGLKSKPVPESVYHRLGDLLDTRGPASSVLPSVQSSSPPSKKPNTTTSTPARSDLPSYGLPTPDSNLRAKRPRSSLAGSRKKIAPGPEDEEPLRCRPVNRLGLMHFKINPAANAGLDYAYNEVVRGQERNCLPGCMKECCIGAFRALAATLPKLTGPNGQVLSDEDLLLDYLGSGSEERIRNLTAKARENLVHDARTKLVADAYGKMHRDVHERGKSPPGFWRTDMPGTQEEREDRELAKLAEREEVNRRYDEAVKGGGRWIFADE